MFNSCNPSLPKDLLYKERITCCALKERFLFTFRFHLTPTSLFLFFIYRSLQIHEETGVPHSRWLEEQRGQEGGDGLGGPLRYPDPCIFWLHSDIKGMEWAVRSSLLKTSL